MNSSNEHYKNDPFNKSGPPNWRIGDALIEFLSGDIADLRGAPRDMHLRYLSATATRYERGDTIRQATENCGTEENRGESERDEGEWRGRNRRGSGIRRQTGEGRCAR